MTATARQVTAVMRRLAPAPVFLATRRAGGEFRVFLPAASAGFMGLPAQRGRDWLSAYLTVYLGEAVHVAAVKFSRTAADCGRTAMITVRPGPGKNIP